ncbi:hypothetical protein Pla110_04750 [Polystyrenella longa]|uniref:Uncharacterized protein n=1 Tax=Polystyrenella longa TaxID=2528007 RepID=A0A518CHT2_9PLAN|nr:hypothetical protein [Polystyrenella longa]QDU78771.1 hypothetical protein Pla110_04750 [Polystyrenella longa]
MNLEDWDVKRRIVGVFAILSWIAAVVFYVTAPESEVFLGGAVRIGAVMSAIWLALPNKDRAAAWANMSGKWWVTLGISTLAMVIRPKLAPGILIVLAIISFLWKSKTPKPVARVNRSQAEATDEKSKSTKSSR